MKCIKYFASGVFCVSNLIITGGSRLCGIIEVPGAKNSVLRYWCYPLEQGTSILENCPELDDVTTMLEILGALGCGIRERKQDRG